MFLSSDFVWWQIIVFSDGTDVQNLSLGQGVNAVIDYGRKLPNHLFLVLDSCSLITEATKFSFIQNGSVLEESS